MHASEELRYKIDTSILIHCSGPVTNTARILGQSGITNPNQVFTTAERISIVSTDANDTVAGTGVQKILIRGYKDGEFEISFISTIFGAMSAKVNTIIDFFFGGSSKKDK